MKKRRTNTSKLNNEGFSLVEVIVAIIIISIVSGAVLSCLVSSARYTKTAKENQYVTGAAQSIMEGVKAQDLKSLTNQFTDPDTTKFKVLKRIGVGAVPYASYSMVPRAVDAAIDVPYEFSILGIDYEGHKYDADITINPYGTPGDPNYGISEVTYIENMNGFRDAVYSQEPTELATGYNAILDQVVAALNSVSGTYKVDGMGVIRWEGNFTREMLFNATYKSKYEISRVTTVDINSTGSGQKVSLNVKYTCKVKNLPYTDSSGGSHNFTQNFDYEVGTTEIYNNMATVSSGAKLENLFLFVYPGYDSSATKYRVVKDEYNITNNLSDQMNVFFVKQLDSSLSSAVLANCESSYKPYVKCVNNINLFHNAKDNLSNPGGPKLGGAAAHFSATNLSYIIDGLTKKEDQGLLYNVKVDIKNAGDTEVLYTFTGSMSDK